ncbi:hypothetical protein BHE74_00043902 [Ensete ventricosum]|nr:hypothetical protein BHE74_00043902 [Ensete ventricosum]RZR84819.1 hypothetical protein BHM03_00011700 [Ensete ventricosum]
MTKGCWVARSYIGRWLFTHEAILPMSPLLLLSSVLTDAALLCHHRWRISDCLISGSYGRVPEQTDGFLRGCVIVDAVVNAFGVGLIILDLAHPLNLQFVGNLRFIPIPTLTLYWYRDPHPHLAVHHQRERRGSEKERKREKDRGRE